MSKICRVILIFLVAAAFILPVGADAQDITAKITIKAREPSRIFVEGRFNGDQPQTEIRFLDKFGGLSELSSRISAIRIGEQMTEMGPNASYKVDNGSDWSYSADISPMKDRFAAAHVSRSDELGGVIVLDDILPQLPAGKRTGRVSFALPTGWTISSSEKSFDAASFDVADIEKAVFFTGPAFRNKSIRVGATEVNLSLMGQWLFTDDVAAQMAASIFSSYHRMFGESPAGRVQIAVLPFPVKTSLGQWEAGSRGSSITIVSSDMPFRNQSLQRLHEQLRHEIFHLWIPNRIQLTGNYDWFYEGFALYQSLKIGVGSNRISFDDMLDALSRAYDVGGRGSGASLTQLSSERWKGSNTQVYARGMLVAFVADLAMLNSAKGKRSVEDLISDIYAKNRTGPPRPAIDALRTAFMKHDELRLLFDRSVLTGESIALEPWLRPAGLEMSLSSQPTQIKTVEKPSGSQRKILDRLGYNNWRKVSGNN